MKSLYHKVIPQNKVIRRSFILIFAFIVMGLFWGFASPMYLHFWGVLGLLVVCDILLYSFLRKYIINDYKLQNKRLYTIIYFLPLALILFICIAPYVVPYQDWHPVARSRFIGVVMILSFTKSVFYFVYVIGIIHFLIKKMFHKMEYLPIKKIFKPYILISYILCAVALFLFGFAFSYGEKRVDLERETVKIDHLPEKFDGYKIVHISDFHLGSVSKKTVKKIVHIIEEQNPDVVCFTGDLVTYSSKEIEGFLTILKGIKAKDGVYAVLGNHDYGTYSHYRNEAGQKEESEKIMSYIRDSLHWNLLNNESVEIRKDSSSAILIGGIENLSTTKRFVSRGDISLAFEGKNINIPVILLSHDPSIWANQITKDYPFVDLTLSGHTHGMQFGISLGKGMTKGHQEKREEIRGMYKHNEKYLYVSKGIGSSLLHGRLGMWADVSVITLEKK